MENLTVKEAKVIDITLNNEYNDASEINYPVWISAVSDYSDNKGKVFSGILSSLSKKGFIYLDGEGNEMTIAVTQKGYDAFKNYKQSK